MPPIARAAVVVAVLSACAANSPKAPAEPGAPLSAEPRPFRVEDPAPAVSAMADAGASPAVPTVEAPATAPPVPSRTVEECATFARFDAPQVAAGAGGGTTVPWMSDPFGDRTKKGTKADPRVVAMQSAFKRCFEAAKKSDPTQVVAIAMEHKPRGGEHRVCVKVTREDGKEEVAKAMTACMLQAIKDHAAR